MRRVSRATAAPTGWPELVKPWPNSYPLQHAQRPLLRRQRLGSNWSCQFGLTNLSLSRLEEKAICGRDDINSTRCAAEKLRGCREADRVDGAGTLWYRPAPASGARTRQDLRSLKADDPRSHSLARHVRHAAGA